MRNVYESGQFPIHGFEVLQPRYCYLLTMKLGVYEWSNTEPRIQIVVVLFVFP